MGGRGPDLRSRQMGAARFGTAGILGRHGDGAGQIVDGYAALLTPAFEPRPYGRVQRVDTGEAENRAHQVRLPVSAV